MNEKTIGIPQPSKGRVAEAYVALLNEIYTSMPMSPIQKFEMNMLKSQILYESAEDISITWPRLVKKLAKKKDYKPDEQLLAALEGLEESGKIGLAMYLGYTEQALVTAITAVESFFEDLFIDCLNHDSRLLYNFGEKKIDVERLIEYDNQKNCPLSVLIAEKLNFQDIEQINKEITDISGVKIFTTEEAYFFKWIFKIRHLILHKAGIIDMKFKKETRCQQDVGKRFSLSRVEIQEIINYINFKIHNINNSIISQRGVRHA